MQQLQDACTSSETNCWAKVQQYDLNLFDNHLRSFVPPGAFDAHCHLFRLEHLQTNGNAFLDDGPQRVTREVYDRCVSAWMGDRCPTGGLFFPLPTNKKMDRPAANRFLIEQIEGDSGSRGLMVIAPSDEPAQVQRQLDESKFVGFKVYHCFADCDDTFFAATDTFLPQWAWQIAHERGLVIMLHMVLPQALADPANQTYIRQHCIDYPGAKLILAHAARGFCSRHTVDGIGALRGLDNVFFDTSAVCEAGAFEAILQTFGPTRLLYGADFPVTEMRSRCVNLGDGFVWLNEIKADFSASRFAKPTLLGIESLLALKQACVNQHLNDSDVEQVFCRSGRDLLGIACASAKPDVQQAYRHAKTLIPGGTQLLSKRPEKFAPQKWPAYYDEARGCEVVDLEGRRYIDMSSCGILATILGFGDPDVNAAVMRRVQKGSMCTQQTYDEVELAELLIQLHPWADMARFARTGGESMAVAVRIARTATGRDKIAICGYHGWHDWYLAANVSPVDRGGNSDQLSAHLMAGLAPHGVPAALAGTVLPFRYNQLSDFDRIIAEHGEELAAVVMEPTRDDPPQPGFLQTVRERCHGVGAKLVYDEITCGWRSCLGGIHLQFAVEPDIAVFAKAISNGYPMAAIIGKADTMQAAQDSFISSTYWTEGIGPAAALATLRKMHRVNLSAHLEPIGRRMMEGWDRLGRTHHVPVTAKGWPQRPVFIIDHPQAAQLNTLFTARMLDKGFLAAGCFNVMYAHEVRHVDAYLEAADEVFAELGAAIKHDDIGQRLTTPVRHGGFARLT